MVVSMTNLRGTEGSEEENALEGQAIVCEQGLAHPMLCLLRAF